MKHPETDAASPQNKSKIHDTDLRDRIMERVREGYSISYACSLSGLSQSAYVKFSRRCPKWAEINNVYLSMRGGPQWHSNAMRVVKGVYGA